jgi:hypothetical protein
MTEVAGYVAALGDAWEHRWESIFSALRGVTDLEADWQAPCYRAEEPEPGWPPPGTIRWQVAHVAHCKRYYAAVLAARGRAKKPAVAARIAPTDFAGETAALEAAHRAQVAGVARLVPSDLDVRVPTGMSVRELLDHQVRHDVWHAAQIVVARRLYRTRSA